MEEQAWQHKLVSLCAHDLFSTTSRLAGCRAAAASGHSSSRDRQDIPPSDLVDGGRPDSDGNSVPGGTEGNGASSEESEIKVSDKAAARSRWEFQPIETF